MMALNGEPGWVCLMCCNSDSRYPKSPPPSIFNPLLPAVLFSAIVIHWVTSKDNAGSGSQTGTNHYNENGSRAGRDPHASTRQMNTIPVAPPSSHGTDSEVSLVAAVNAQSSDDGRDMDIAKVSTTSGGGGVVVTTTIHRQSRPASGFSLDMDAKKVKDDDGEATYGYSPRSPTYGVNNHHDIPEPPRTRITAGSQKDPCS